MDRDKLQSEIVDSFCSLPNHRGLAILATGLGKGKISLMIIKRLKPKKILFITNSVNGRDITLKDEFIKWKMKTWLRKTEFVTYQLAYKWRKDKKDLSNYFIVADEADFAMTSELGRFFYEYRDIATLAMTGYVPKEKQRLYNNMLPVFVNIPAEELQEKDVLNNVKFILVQYALSKEVSRRVEYTKFGKPMSFMSSENEVYMHFFKQEKEATGKMMAAISSNDIANVARYTKVIEEYIPRNRAIFLHTLDSSIELSKRLLIELREDETNKVITFSERTAQADRIAEWSYHGSMDKKEGDKIFEKFREGQIMELSTCAKINRDTNIDGLNCAILESYTSSNTELIQRRGRLMRLSPEQEGVFYILLPYYINNGEAYPTQAVKWIRKTYPLIRKSKYEILNYTGAKKVHK